MTEDILVSSQDGIATVTFNRPTQRNASAITAGTSCAASRSTWKLTRM